MIDEIYNSNQLNNINIIFNGIKPRGIFRQGFGQGYGQGYGYGYGYGYYEEDAKKETPVQNLRKTLTNLNPLRKK